MYNGSTYMNSHLHINILKNVKEKSLITYDRVPPHCGSMIVTSLTST